MSFFQNLCPAPLPSCFMLFSWALSRPTVLPLQSSGGTARKYLALGREYCIISSLSRYSSLHLSCFLQHVQQHLSVNLLGWVKGTQCLLEVHPLSYKVSWNSRDNVCHFGGSPTGCLGPNSYHTSLKVTSIPLDQISTPVLWNIWSVASYQFVLKPLANSYNQDPGPF